MVFAQLTVSLQVYRLYVHADNGTCNCDNRFLVTADAIFIIIMRRCSHNNETRILLSNIVDENLTLEYLQNRTVNTQSCIIIFFFQPHPAVYSYQQIHSRLIVTLSHWKYFITVTNV